MDGGGTDSVPSVQSHFAAEEEVYDGADNREENGVWALAEQDDIGSS